MLWRRTPSWRTLCARRDGKIGFPATPHPGWSNFSGCIREADSSNVCAAPPRTTGRGFTCLLCVVVGVQHRKSRVAGEEHFPFAFQFLSALLFFFLPADMFSCYLCVCVCVCGSAPPHTTPLRRAEGGLCERVCVCVCGFTARKRATTLTHTHTVRTI